MCPGRIEPRVVRKEGITLVHHTKSFTKAALGDRTGATRRRKEPIWAPSKKDTDQAGARQGSFEPQTEEFRFCLN